MTHGTLWAQGRSVDGHQTNATFGHRVVELQRTFSQMYVGLFVTYVPRSVRFLSAECVIVRRTILNRPNVPLQLYVVYICTTDSG